MSMDSQGTTWRRNSAENFNRLSRVHDRYMTTDRQTTGGLTFTFAKNVEQLAQNPILNWQSPHHMYV